MMLSLSLKFLWNTVTDNSIAKSLLFYTTQGVSLTVAVAGKYKWTLLNETYQFVSNFQILIGWKKIGNFYMHCIHRDYSIICVIQQYLWLYTTQGANPTVAVSGKCKWTLLNENQWFVSNFQILIGWKKWQLLYALYS